MFGVVLLILYECYRGNCWQKMDNILLWGVIFQMGILPGAHIVTVALLMITNLAVATLWALLVMIGRVVFYIFVFIIFFNKNNDCKENALALWVAVLLMVIQGCFVFLYFCCGVGIGVKTIKDDRGS